MTKGVKNAPQLKIPDLKPLADKVDQEKSVDQLAPKAVDKPAITTDSKSAPTPKTDTSKPDAKAASKRSKPDPKADAKADPKPDQKPDQKQADKPKTPDYKPDQIANLLKKDAAKDAAKAERQFGAAESRTRRNSTPIRWRSCSTSATRSASLLPPHTINDNVDAWHRNGAQDAQLITE